jgi:hypothetical protein
MTAPRSTALSRTGAPPSPEMLFAWWESRRPTYNLIVGGAGLLTLGTIEVLSLLPPYVPLQVPWQLVVVYGVLANVCYSFGFMLETAPRTPLG